MKRRSEPVEEKPRATGIIDLQDRERRHTRDLETVGDQHRSRTHLRLCLFVKARHRYGRQEAVDHIILGKIRIPQALIEDRRIGTADERYPELGDQCQKRCSLITVHLNGGMMLRQEGNDAAGTTAQIGDAAGIFPRHKIADCLPGLAIGHVERHLLLRAVPEDQHAGDEGRAIGPGRDYVIVDDGEGQKDLHRQPEPPEAKEPADQRRQNALYQQDFEKPERQPPAHALHEDETTEHDRLRENEPDKVQDGLENSAHEWVLRDGMATSPV